MKHDGKRRVQETDEEMKYDGPWTSHISELKKFIPRPKWMIEIEQEDNHSEDTETETNKKQT